MNQIKSNHYLEEIRNEQDIQYESLWTYTIRYT